MVQQHHQRITLFGRQQAEIFQQQGFLRRSRTLRAGEPAVAQPFRAGIQPFCQRLDFIRSRNRPADQPMVERLRTDRLIGMAQVEAVGEAGIGQLVQTREAYCCFQTFAEIGFVLFGMHNGGL